MWRWWFPIFVLAACTGGSDADPVTQPGQVTPPGTATTLDVETDTTTTLVVDTDAVVPTGFELVAARVTAVDGTVCEPCLWLADSAEQRSRGLMGVTDLGPADGMAFRFPGPYTTRFWMKDTLLPLSIAFFGVDGALIDSFDMDPCVAEDSSDCLRYPTPPNFVVAVETYQGGLEALDMTTGSMLELLDLPCQL